MAPNGYTLHQTEVGAKITYLDGRARRTGTILAYQRSSKHPWKVYLVQRDDGIGNPFLAPNGEVWTAVEVHPDRVRS